MGSGIWLGGMIPGLGMTWHGVGCRGVLTVIDYVHLDCGLALGQSLCVYMYAFQLALRDGFVRGGLLTRLVG